MNFDKITLFIVIGIIAIVLFDMYSKYDEKKRKDDMKAQSLANQTMIQLQEAQNEQMNANNQSGFLGQVLGGLPLIGGLF